VSCDWNFVEIAGVPVQFLGAPLGLGDEAVANAKEVKLGRTTVRVVTAEYLVALARGRRRLAEAGSASGGDDRGWGRVEAGAAEAPGQVQDFRPRTPVNAWAYAIARRRQTAASARAKRAWRRQQARLPIVAKLDSIIAMQVRQCEIMKATGRPIAWWQRPWGTT
jgi:hypothetical protein